jgi:hypothetical protein
MQLSLAHNDVWFHYDATVYNIMGVTDYTNHWTGQFGAIEEVGFVLQQNSKDW